VAAKPIIEPGKLHDGFRKGSTHPTFAAIAFGSGRRVPGRSVRAVGRSMRARKRSPRSGRPTLSAARNGID